MDILIQPMVEQVEENLGKTPGEISVDAGYFSYDVHCAQYWKDNKQNSCPTS